MRHPFLRTLAGTTTDPNFENVTLLLHGDGTNGGQNNTFVDGSTNSFTITRNGNTTQGTFSPYGDNWSNYFDGNDWLEIANNAAFNLSSSNFTVEAWVYVTVSGVIRQIIAKNSGAYASGFEWNFNITAANKLLFDCADSSATYYQAISTGSVSSHTWTHVAAVRNGSTITLYINGTADGTLTPPTIRTTTSAVTIGRDLETGGGRYLTGYISNVRVVKGSAVYTANFTPSTTPLTAITNTSLLTCQSNRFRDASTNNFTITRNGDVSVQRFSPFSPTAAYAAGTIGGSGYFDGTGDYLTSAVSDNIVPTTGDFTAECWFYATASTSGEMFSFRTNSSSFAALRFRRASTSLDLLISTSGSAWAINNSGTVGTVPQNAWNHLAVVRDGGTFRVFANGVSVFTSTAISAGTALMSGTTNNFIGCSSTTSPFNLITGYLADCRVVQSAVYTANFTPPTAPLTAITNTSLLLNFTNAAILDNAMMSDLETVGNAQIDTTTKKFGTGSLEFDGNGDYLRVRTSPELDLVTGNFTIEFWVYLNSLSSGNRVVLSKDGVSGSSYAQYALRFNTNGTLTATIGSGNGISYNQAFTSTTAFSTATWYHVALVRSGTTVSLYVNGTSEASATQTGTMTTGNKALLIGWEESQPLTHYLDGYIDDLRITKGVARYTANFTAPTAAFPDL